MNAKQWWSLGLLGTIILALLFVGAISGTLLRHAVQVSPAAILVGLVLARRTPGWPAAALAIDLLWLTIMLLIWLYLTGVARIVSGQFSAAEVALSVVIGIAAIAGSALAVVEERTATWPALIAAFVLAVAFQTGAMWLSLQPWIAPR